MTGSFKERMFDKAIDCILDMLSDTADETLEELLNKNTRQKILYKTIRKFVDSQYFKGELKSAIYSDNKEAVLNVDSDAIAPSNSLEQIQIAIMPVIEASFASEDRNDLLTIAKHVAVIYQQRAKMTIQLFDIVKLQQDSLARVSGDIAALTDIVSLNQKYELELRLERETLLQKELTNEVSGIIFKMMDYYLNLITKYPPSFTGAEMDHLDEAKATRTKEVAENIDNYVHEDFCTVPVVVLLPTSMEGEKKEIPCIGFMEQFRCTVLSNTDKLLKYKDNVDLETYVFILRLRNKLQSVLFPPIHELGIQWILSANSYAIDVSFFCRELSEIGMLLYSLYQKLLVKSKQTYEDGQR